jgi:hypothetical protein
MSNRFDAETIAARFLPVLKLFSTGEIKDNFFINPASVRLNPKTYMARLRDAVKAIRTGLYHPPVSVDLDRLFSEWSRFRMEEKGEQVVFYLRTGSETPELTLGNQVPSITIPFDMELIDAAAKLLGARCLRGPIKVDGVLGPRSRDMLTGSYDIVIEVKEDHTLLI